MTKIYCKLNGRNVECEYAGEITYFGSKEFGEKEGMHKCTYCYNDSIGRDPSKCNKKK
jgi:hypothetical protein